VKRKTTNCSNCGEGDLKTLPLGVRRKLLCLECAKLPEFRVVVLKNIYARRRQRDSG
jgi:hypothetical protein